VNHQWDEQYRLQRADIERLDSELCKRAGQTGKVAEARRQNPVTSEDTTKIIEQLTQKNGELEQIVAKLLEKQKQRMTDTNSSEETTKFIQQLTQRNEQLAQEVAGLLEERKKRDKLWPSAKKLIMEEKAAKEASMEMRAVIMIIVGSATLQNMYIYVIVKFILDSWIADISSKLFFL
jgi:Rad3-related DNA helicase